MMKSTRSHSAGFTLIELMVVLFILALFSTVIVPAVASALQRGGVRADGEKLCDLLNFAYMTAVTQRVQVVVHLDAERGRCWAALNAPQLPWRIQEDTDEKARILEMMALAKDTRLSCDAPQGPSFGQGAPSSLETLTFQSDGGAEDRLIRLTGTKGKGYEIEVAGATGQVHGHEVQL